MYPFNCLGRHCKISIITHLIKFYTTISILFSYTHRESVIIRTIVALTKINRWRRPDLYLSERGEEPGSALQVYST